MNSDVVWLGRCSVIGREKQRTIWVVWWHGPTTLAVCLVRVASSQRVASLQQASFSDASCRKAAGE